MIKKDIEHVKITTKPNIHDPYWIAISFYFIVSLSYRISKLISNEMKQ